MIGIKRFDLHEVRLTEGTRLHKKMMQNCDYLLALDCDRLLYHFRQYAGLDTKAAKGYGGWEGEWSAIKGEFMGHYICACINSYHNLKGNNELLAAEFQRRVHYIVDELGICQEAIAEKKGEGYPHQFGYVAAIPTTQLDMVETLHTIDGYDGGVPYYVHHKTLKGLVAAYEAFQNEKALKIASAFTDYIYKRLKDYDDEHMEKMLNSHRYPVQYFKEFGGMHEVLIDLYKITNDTTHLELAKKFDRTSFRNALINDVDTMAHHMQHANSEIPCVSGMGAYYELTGDEDYKKGVMNFMSWMTNGHTFSTGGTSGPSVYPDYGGEFFNYPNLFYGHVTYTNPDRHKDSGESCCAHNLNKIGDQVFTWTGDPQIADEYEKRFVNCVMPQQNDDTGMFLYNLNLSQGTTKGFGTPDDSFWCCYCSGIEAYSSLQNGAFYYKDDQIWLNNFLDCTLTYEEMGLVLREETTFPDNGQIGLTFSLEEPKALHFHIRIPYWAKGDVIIKINGDVINEAITPSSYVTLSRVFKNGDVIDIHFDYKLYTERMPDRPDYVAVKYGPNVLVACTTPFSVFPGNEEALLEALKPTGIPCEFTAKLSKGLAVFKPLHKVQHELYNGYTIIGNPIEEQTTDVIRFEKEEQTKAHNTQGEHFRKKFMRNKLGIGTNCNGWFSLDMTIDPSEKMYLKCLYWGSEYGEFHNFTPTIRLFDIQVKEDNGEYVNIATQLLDHIEPNSWHDKIYPIPFKYTQGKESISIRFKAKKFGDVQGVVGNLYEQISIHYY